MIMKKSSISILILIFISLLISGCVYAPEKNPASPATVSTDTISNISHQDDFVILISKDGWAGINGTGTIAKNFSEIRTNNYTGIPLLLEPNTSYCGYTPKSNYSRVAEVALNDSRIRKVLRNGGIIQGIYFWGPPVKSSEMTKDTCMYCYITLEFNYQGKHELALINETTNTVILTPELS